MTALRLASLFCLLNTLASVVCAQAELEGTLFTSPEQRAYLDYLRQDFLARSRERGFDISTTEVPDIPTADTAAEDSAPVVHRLGGIVTLRDGTQRIWLNGQALGEDELPEGFSLISHNGALLLSIIHEGRHYELKAGQSLELGGEQGPQEHYAFTQRQQEQTDATTMDPHDPPLPDDQIDDSLTEQAAEPGQPNSNTQATAQSAADGELPSAESLTDSIMALNPAEMELLLEALEQAQSGGEEDAATEIEDDDAE